MKKQTWFALAGLTTSLGLVFALSAQASVRVNIDGASNGDLLIASGGPAGINKNTKVSASGGTISSAFARAFFNRRKVLIGNKVISAGTLGDQYLTHVRAGSLFTGTATFHANKKGTSVKNFTINFKNGGTLGCKTPDPMVPEGYSMAAVESNVDVDGANRFSGSATQDGAGPFTATGDYVGGFSEGSNTASIDRTYGINLGTLKDRQKLRFNFFGSTLVSYGEDVPIDFCYANFANTSNFKVSKQSLGKGSLSFQPAQEVTIYFDPESVDVFQPPASFTVYVEGPQLILKKIALPTIDLYAFMGDNGNIQPTAMGEIGDQDEDGISDRGLTFSPDELTTMLLNSYETESIELYLTGESRNGKSWTGTNTLTLE